MQQRVSAALHALPNGWQPMERVSGRVSGGDGAEWQLELVLSSGAGEAHRRRLSAPHCDELADAAAVAIAIALGGAASSGQAPASGAPASADTTRDVRVDASSAALEAPEPSAAWALSVAAEGVVDSGLLAGVSWGAAAGARLEQGGWSAALYGLWLPERADPLAAGQGVDYRWLAAGVHGCRPALGVVLQLGGCAGLELGVLGAAGYGLSQAVDSTATLLVPNLSAGLRWPLGLSADLLGR